MGLEPMMNTGLKVQPVRRYGNRSVFFINNHMMNPHDFRNLILAMEARLPDTEYEETSNEVIARMKS